MNKEKLSDDIMVVDFISFECAYNEQVERLKNGTEFDVDK